MSGWKAKRFWAEARTAEAPGGWEVRLDGRPVRTPAKAPLVLPTRALAEAIAEEWDEQKDEIDPRRMPLTRAANAAIDKVAVQRDEVVAMLAAYGETDLLCHRADHPEELVRRQRESWDPLLAWAAAALGASLAVTEGVIGVAQPAESLDRLRAEVDALDPFELTAFHDLVALSGSLIIGLAALKRAESAETLWRASRLDEEWQAELWGSDAEAAEAAEEKRAAFFRAIRLLDLVGSRG